MSQVKNLRAMFENKGDTSPPDRGRSPGLTPSRHIGSKSRGKGGGGFGLSKLFFSLSLIDCAVPVTFTVICSPKQKSLFAMPKPSLGLLEERLPF